MGRCITCNFSASSATTSRLHSFASKSQSWVCIPISCRTWRWLLKQAAERTQVIVTTHSDLLLDEFTDVPEAVMVFDRSEDGQTETVPAVEGATG